MREIGRGERRAIRADKTRTIVASSRRVAEPGIPTAANRVRKRRATGGLGIAACAWLLMCGACGPPVPDTPVDQQHLVLDFRPPDLPDTVSELDATDEGSDGTSEVAETTTGISPAGVTGSVDASGADSTQPPIADAGPDLQVLSRSTVELDASGSRDASAVQFAWVQSAGPAVTLTAPYSMRTPFVAPTVEEGSVTLEFDLTVRRTPLTLGYFGADTVIVVVSAEADLNSGSPDAPAITPTGESQHAGMDVELVRTIGTDRVEVETLGARVAVTTGGIDFTSTIDYTTGQLASEFPTGRLVWTQPATELTVGSVTKRCAEILTAHARICVYGDSLVRIEAVAPVSYVYTSLLAAPEWVKGFGPNRMWAVPRGGSLHLLDGAGSGSYAPGTDVTVNLPAGAHSGVAVFPPRPLDLSQIYDVTARPHVHFVHTTEAMNQLNADPDGYYYMLNPRAFGTIVLFGTLYTEQETAVVDTADGVTKYFFTDAQAVHAFTSEAHRRGMKVITYMKANYFAGQPVDHSLNWMRAFKAEYDLDGWYFDNAKIASTWWENYDFMRTVREDVGADGIIYHHDSVDVWGTWSGAVCVPLDAYADYTLKGETGAIARMDDPDNPYFLYYTKGFSGNLADHKLSQESTMTNAELMNVLVELGCVKRLGDVGVLDWDAHYWTPFQEVRDAWQPNSP